MESIVTLTMNPAVDKSSSVDNVTPDRKLRCAAPVFDPGGGGINVSRAVLKLGGTSTAVFPSGGPPGDILARLLDREGVDRARIPVQSWTRENLSVYENNTEHQYRFGMPGAELTEEEQQRCLDAVKSVEPPPRYIVGSGSLPRGVPDDFYARLARLGRELDARVIVDTSGPPLRYAVEEGVFLVKPNLRELRSLAGSELPNDADRVDFARDLISRAGCEVVVVSLGAAGVLLVTSDRARKLSAPTVNVKSKVGAGDSTVAGIVVRLASGRDTLDAVLYGIAAGAGAVMTPGTQLCNKEDVDRLYDNIQQRERGEEP